MAKGKKNEPSRLAYALLLAAAFFMNSARGFLVHLPMGSSSSPAGTAGSWVDAGGSVGRQHSSSSRPVVKRAERTRRRYLGAVMKTAAAGWDRPEGQPRSGRTRISFEARSGLKLGGGGGGGGDGASSSSLRNQGSTGAEIAALRGETEGHGTDSGGGAGGGGDGGGGKGGDGQRGGGGEGEGDSADDLEIAAKGRRRARIARKVNRAVQRGKIPKSSSKAYAKLLTSPLMSLLCQNSSWRARLLGDSTFITKLGIEMVTGTGAQFLAEYQKRGKKFMEELDFVFADTLTCLFANFAAVWLSCPTVTVKRISKKEAAKAGGALQKFLASCPSNAFQKVAVEGGVSKRFSVAQRGAALLLPMPKLFVIGFGATVTGFGLIAGLERYTAMRKNAKLVAACKRDPKEAAKMRKNHALVPKDEKPPVPVLGSGLAVGTFLAVWTNFRYQVIAGAVEQRVFDTLLAKQPRVSSLASTAVRSANLYIGSLTVVDWLRFVGLQH